MPYTSQSNPTKSCHALVTLTVNEYGVSRSVRLYSKAPKKSLNSQREGSKMVKRTRLSADSKALAFVLRQHCENRLSFREIAKRCNMFKSKVYRLFNGNKSKARSVPMKPDRPRKLNQCGTLIGSAMRTLIRTIKKLRRINVNFTVTNQSVSRSRWCIN